jgi:DNA mismatch endonuclease, patch repair protein
MDRSEIMRRVRSTDTTPECVVRSALHRRGYRYRLHAKELPGCPDIVFPGRRVIIFINGCWWHGHGCKRGARVPKNNALYWRRKIDRNVQRDFASVAALRHSGWRVAIVWECAITRNAEDVTARLVRFLKRKQARRS